MVDTVSIICRREFTKEPIGWQPKVTPPVCGGDGVSRYFLSHPDGHIRLFGSSSDSGLSMIDKVETELPCLIYPHNGYQLQSQDQMDQALVALHKLLDGFSKRLVQANGEHFSRVDLVSHFPSEAARQFLKVYRNLHVPGINAGGRRDGQNLSWFGAEQDFVVYEKCRQIKKTKKLDLAVPELWRFEYRLKGSKLKKLVGLGQPVTQLDYSHLRGVYWQYLESLLNVQISSTGKTTADYFAAMERQYPGACHLDDYIRIRQLKDRPADNLRRLVGKCTVRSSKFKFRDHLAASDELRVNQDYYLRLQEFPR